jgi:hypothetical protein
MHVRSRPTWTLLVLAVLLSLTAGAQTASAGITVSKKGNTLYVNGTRGDEWVFITGVDGLPGVVTVQAEGQPMTAHFGFQNMSINMSGGYNGVVVVQVNLPGNLSIAGGNGTNEVHVGLERYMPNLIWGNLNVNFTGLNTIELEQTWILGAADFDLGDIGNQVVIGRADTMEDLGAVILGGLTVTGGEGHDQIEVAKSWIGGEALFETAGGDDHVILGTHYPTDSPIAGNVFDGNLGIYTGGGEDGVGLTDSTFNGDVEIETGNDDDELYLGDAPDFPPNDFSGDVYAHGGGGQDFLNDDPGNSYASNPEFHSFEDP